VSSGTPDSPAVQAAPSKRLLAFQPAVAEAVSERLLVGAENVDAEYPVTLDQREGRGFTVDTDQ
jgi:hypothetical protein